MPVILNQDELDELFIQDPMTILDGGYQRLLINLQNKTNRSTGELDLSDDDLEKIPRYAFNYGQGGWENRLKTIFERHLGPNLDDPDY